jgi:hypothetical protein
LDELLESVLAFCAEGTSVSACLSVFCSTDPLLKEKERNAAATDFRRQLVLLRDLLRAGGVPIHLRLLLLLEQ